jgi:hypothetical protein
VVYYRISNLFFIGNDMSHVHVSLDPVTVVVYWVYHRLVGAPCGGRARTRELHAAGHRERERGNDGLCSQPVKGGDKG